MITDWTTLDLGVKKTAKFYAFGHTVDIAHDGKRWSVRVFDTTVREFIRPGKKPSSKPIRSAEPDFEVDVIADIGDQVSFRPLLPGRPVVVILSEPFTLFPQEHVSGCVTLPCDLRAESADGKPLVDIPLVLLPPTWFGNTEEGELCFALKTSMTFGSPQEVLDGIFDTDGILCPVFFKNLSRSPVLIETFSIPAESCPIRKVKGMPVTDEVLIYCEADGDLNIEIRPLKLNGEALETLSLARVSRSEKLVRRGLHFLSRITGLQIG